MEKKGLVLFRTVGTKGTVEDQFVDLVPQESGGVFPKAVSEPVRRFFFQRFHVRRRETAFCGEEEGPLVVREAVVDGRRVRHRESRLPWRERNDMHVEQGRGFLSPGGGEEFLVP